jgi:hypothetical protein
MAQPTIERTIELLGESYDMIVDLLEQAKLDPQKPMYNNARNLLDDINDEIYKSL